MPFPEESLRVGIAGAASLRGQDLKIWIENSGFPSGEVRLFDEEILAGTLTDMAGEAALIQGVDQDSFHGLGLIFFAGSRAFAKKHAPTAARSGATVIDLTGELASQGARSWIPKLDGLLPPPRKANGAGTNARILLAPSAPAIVATSFCAALSPLGLRRLAITFLAPSSERGKEGVEELSQQTISLLSMQPAPQEVFDCQVAFNLVDRFGAGSAESLASARAAIEREVRDYLDGRLEPPALSLIQAPVFYGHGFSAFAEFNGTIDPAELGKRLEAAGFQIAKPDDPPPSNVSAAGEANPVVSAATADGAVANAYWFWGAADNHRLPVSNALQIAEKMLIA